MVITHMTFSRMATYKIRKSLIYLAPVVTALLLSQQAAAEQVYHPSGPKLTFGGMSHRSLYVSDMGNPAQPAVNPENRGSIGASIGLGIEYDGNDNLFNAIDELSNRGALDSESTASGDGGDGTSSGDSSGERLDTIISDFDNPELQALVTELTDKVTTLAALVAISTTGLQAKAFASADVPVLISSDSLGGAWTLGINSSLSTRIRGLNDPIEFDFATALTDIQNTYDANELKAASEPVTFDLSGGLAVTVDPNTGETSYEFTNNSGVVTRAAQITEISIGYSREVWREEDRKITVGVRPKFISAGLSNAVVFIENIENAETIFDSLDESSFKYTEDISLDLGVTLSAKRDGRHYLLGATLTNINEPDFDFPDADLSGITDQFIIDAIRARQTYTMESQVKLEAGMLSRDGSWGLNAGLDINPVLDPMRDEYQWFSISGGYASDSWWLPGARLGLRHNMTGSELTYLTAGITAFKILNIDLASSTDTVDIDGTTVPRGLILNLGIQVHW